MRRIAERYLPGKWDECIAGPPARRCLRHTRVSLTAQPPVEQSLVQRKADLWVRRATDGKATLSLIVENMDGSASPFLTYARFADMSEARPEKPPTVGLDTTIPSHLVKRIADDFALVVTANGITY